MKSKHSLSASSKAKTTKKGIKVVQSDSRDHCPSTMQRCSSISAFCILLMSEILNKKIENSIVVPLSAFIGKKWEGQQLAAIIQNITKERLFGLWCSCCKRKPPDQQYEAPPRKIQSKKMKQTTSGEVQSCRIEGRAKEATQTHALQYNAATFCYST